MCGKLHPLQGSVWQLCSPAGWDSGKDPASSLGSLGFTPAQHLLPIFTADWGQLHCRVHTCGLLPLLALSHRREPIHPVLPGDSDTSIPLGRARLTEVRRMRRHSSDRMATIARETELCCSSVSNFSEARMVPNLLGLCSVCPKSLCFLRLPPRCKTHEKRAKHTKNEHQASASSQDWQERCNLPFPALQLQA